MPQTPQVAFEHVSHCIAAVKGRRANGDDSKSGCRSMVSVASLEECNVSDSFHWSDDSTRTTLRSDSSVSPLAVLELTPGTPLPSGADSPVWCHSPYGAKVLPDHYVAEPFGIVERRIFLPSVPVPRPPAPVPRLSALPPYSKWRRDRGGVVTRDSEGRRIILQVGNPDGLSQFLAGTPVGPPCEEELSSPAAFVISCHHKCHTTNCLASRSFPVGTIVKLDGDQGYDIGEVAVCVPLAEYLDSHSRRAVPTLWVHSVASREEAHHFTNVLQLLESGCLRFLSGLAEEARRGTIMGDIENREYWREIAGIQFVDVELQADHGKLYVYYRSPAEVRFRSLSTMLYTQYHCRVWFHQLDKSVSSSTNTSTSSAESL